MVTKVLPATLLAFLLGAQEPNPMQRFGEMRRETIAPIYRINVVARTVKAVNYSRGSGPTKIGLSGTVLMPDASGEARIKPEPGAVQVQAQFKNLTGPERFGPQYLTYVLWAITPEGRATNLGEILTDGSNRGRLKTSSPLQTFALIVTAEPYYAVTQPSDVVVVENVIRPDTAGRIQTVDARYELLRRGEFTLDVGAARQAEDAERPKVPLEEYNALLALYQAKNAVQLAQAEGAANHAPEIVAKAEARLVDAEAFYARNPGNKAVVTLAREATQAAEDARLVALRKESGRESRPD
jgi:hypothetical protein